MEQQIEDGLSACPVHSCSTKWENNSRAQVEDRWYVCVKQQHSTRSLTVDGYLISYAAFAQPANQIGGKSVQGKLIH